MFDPENNVVIYLYEISGGKIVGEGSKVIWDLSNVQTGTYTTTVRADDRCGKCGKSMSQEIRIVECSDC